MAKQKGFIKLIGSLGGLTFYRRGGVDLIRTTGGVEKKRIENDPAFKRTRENMSEFGGSAVVGKALRTGFAGVVGIMSDTNFVGRVTGMMRHVNAAGAGKRGERAFEILSKGKPLLEGFEFDESTTLASVFYAPNPLPTLDANRSVATWVIPNFNSGFYVHAPEGATHFRLVLATTVLSDYEYSPTDRKYMAVHAAMNSVNGVAYSDAIALGAFVGGVTSLSVDLGFTTPLPASVGVVSAVGIVFYQTVNTVLYELADGNAMHVAVVE